MKQGLIIQIIGVVNGKSTTNPDILYRKGRILNKETDKNKRSDQEEK
jgi:translation elongation factor EF-1alpha|tara:strand:+ start:1639 stop:1779 length:141 start_codon:yes stop_codon:yes gene_type:complete